MYLNVRGVLFLLVVYQIRESVCDIERFDTGVEEHEREEEQKRQDQRKLILEVLNEERQEMLQAQLQDYKNLRHEIRYLSIEIATLKNEKNETETKYKQEIDDMKDELKFYDLSIKELRKNVEVLQHADVQINRKIGNCDKIDVIEKDLKTVKDNQKMEDNEESIKKLNKELKEVSKKIPPRVKQRLVNVEETSKLLKKVVKPKKLRGQEYDSEVHKNKNKIKEVEESLKALEANAKQYESISEKDKEQNSVQISPDQDVISRLELVENKTNILYSVVKPTRANDGNYHSKIQENNEQIQDLQQQVKLDAQSSHSGQPERSNDNDSNNLRNELNNFISRASRPADGVEELEKRNWKFDESLEKYYYMNETVKVYSTLKAAKRSIIPDEEHFLIFEKQNEMNQVEYFYRFADDKEERDQQNWQYDEAKMKYYFINIPTSFYEQVRIYANKNAVRLDAAHGKSHLVYKNDNGYYYRNADDNEINEKHEWKCKSYWRRCHFFQWDDIFYEHIQVYSSENAKRDSYSLPCFLVFHDKERNMYYRYADQYEKTNGYFDKTDIMGKFFTYWSSILQTYIHVYESM